jgi:ABC-type phosphate transport system auxiliary subunit
MVLVDISQLSKECNGWKEKLRAYRAVFNHNEVRLRKVTSLSLTKDQFKSVEHFHNQFHIQLINIHDVKQKIKIHERKMNFEMEAFNESANEDCMARHESLLEEYQSLQKILKSLHQEFKDFLFQLK